MTRWLLTLLLLLAMPPVVAGPVYRNLRYAPVPAGVDPNLLSLDVYLPDGAPGSWPIMIYVHGGGWSAGDKNNVGLKAQSFNEHGYVFVSINYRLSPAAQFPTHAQDVAAAIAYVRRSAASVGADPAQISLIGHSAGAHLVALVASDARYLQAQGMHPRGLRSVIALDTQAYDLNLLRELNGGNLPAIYTSVFGSSSEQLVFASPQTYVNPAAAIPPMVAAYTKGISGDELPERRSATEHYIGALAAARNLTQIIPAPEKFHDQINEEFGRADDHVTVSAYEFLAQANFYQQRGLWYDPAHAGHGFDLQFAGNRPTGLFYTYDNDGSPSWLLLDGAPMTGASSETQALRFRMDAGVAVLDRVAGSMRFDYGVPAGECTGNAAAQAAPSRIRARWTLDGVSGDWCLIPLLLANSAPTPNGNGIWYAGEADRGWGLSIAERTDAGGGVATQILYHYDGSGAPRWSLAQGTAAQLEQPLSRYQGYCRPCAPVPLIAASAGEISARALAQTPGVRVRALNADGSSFARDSAIYLLTDPVR